jgi:hypothetical protein
MIVKKLSNKVAVITGAARVLDLQLRSASLQKERWW